MSGWAPPCRFPGVTELPRLRQAVLAARDLDAVAGALRRRLGLGEPYADPGVEHFGLRNAVFALGDTFLEVLSPIRPDTAAGRLIERRGGDCGYMLMFQVEDLEAARRRVEGEHVREVFEVSLQDMSEVHLHPADMRAAIVSLSQPRPPEAWRWGGPDWSARSAPLRVTGATITVAQPVSVAARWDSILDVELNDVGVRVSADEFEGGLTEVIVTPDNPGDWAARREPIVIGGVRFVPELHKDDTPSPYESQDVQEE
jgi:Glyoxalase-like domain